MSEKIRIITVMEDGTETIKEKYPGKKVRLKDHQSWKETSKLIRKKKEEDEAEKAKEKKP